MLNLDTGINNCHLGYRYFLKIKNRNDSKYWISVKCNATATNYADSSVVVRDKHTHSPDETDKQVLLIPTNLKRKLIEESGSADRIVEEVFHKKNAKPNDLL